MTDEETFPSKQELKTLRVVQISFFFYYGQYYTIAPLLDDFKWRHRRRPYSENRNDAPGRRSRRDRIFTRCVMVEKWKYVLAPVWHWTWKKKKHRNNDERHAAKEPRSGWVTKTRRRGKTTTTTKTAAAGDGSGTTNDDGRWWGWRERARTSSDGRQNNDVIYTDSITTTTRPPHDASSCVRLGGECLPTAAYDSTPAADRCPAIASPTSRSHRTCARMDHGTGVRAAKTKKCNRTHRHRSPSCTLACVSVCVWVCGCVCE